MSLAELVSISRFYGSNADYVVAGGGNSSWKNTDELYIKKSGVALAGIGPTDFVKLRRPILAKIWQKPYPDSADERESAVLADLLAARAAGEAQKRPSVESLLHDLLPFAFVVHTHPALVNGLTCSVRGAVAMTELFGDEALWIPSIDPGYLLAQAVKQAISVYQTQYNRRPAVLFLQNHGLFVAADSVAEIKAQYEQLMSSLQARVSRQPDLKAPLNDYGPSAEVGAALLDLLAKELGAPVTDQPAVRFHRSGEISRLCTDTTAFAAVASAFTPDHIVYAGREPLFVDTGPALPASLSEIIKPLTTAWQDYLAKFSQPPRIIALRKLGVFGLGTNLKTAQLALELFIDAAKVACYSEAFGGPRFMDAERIEFIVNWEVERYRSAVASN